MSCTSLEGSDLSSSSDVENLVEANSFSELNKNFEMQENVQNEQRLLLQNSHSCVPLEQSSNAFVQEPSSDNDLNPCTRTASYVQTLLTSKDEHISNLQKLLNCQREQLYYFLKTSIKSETLLKLKNSCQGDNELNHNENLSMALDKFKYENNFPTERTLLRENVSRIIIRLERLMKHQEKLIKTMEFNSSQKCTMEVEGLNRISCYQYNLQDVYIQKHFLCTAQIVRELEAMKILLKRLGLIEEERIHLIERVYSLPADQRRYYAHLTIVERKKMQIEADTEKMNENYVHLKQKYSALQEMEEKLNRFINTQIGDFDLNKLKPGLKTHVKMMEMVERGELSLITMTKDEKGKFTNDFVKLRNENEELMEKLKDFDKHVQERDDLRKQIKILVENCLQLEKEVKSLKSSSKTDVLLNQPREARAEKEQLKMQLNRIAKEDPGVPRICGETVNKATEERDQLRLNLAEYDSSEEDINTLKFKASQSDIYRAETERLKLVVSELEEIKAAYMAFLDKNSHNPSIISPLDRDMYRNMFKELKYLENVESDKKQLMMEISRFKHALLKQEVEIKDLVAMVDRLVEQLKIARINLGTITVKVPEELEITHVLSSEEEKRLEEIRNRIYHVAYELVQPIISMTQEEQPKSSNGKNDIMSILKYFLGFDTSQKKTIE